MVRALEWWKTDCKSFWKLKFVYFNYFLGTTIFFSGKSLFEAKRQKNRLSGGSKQTEEFDQILKKQTEIVSPINNIAQQNNYDLISSIQGKQLQFRSDDHRAHLCLTKGLRWRTKHVVILSIAECARGLSCGERIHSSPSVCPVSAAVWCKTRVTAPRALYLIYLHLGVALSVRCVCVCACGIWQIAGLWHRVRHARASRLDRWWHWRPDKSVMLPQLFTSLPRNRMILIAGSIVHLSLWTFFQLPKFMNDLQWNTS